MATTRKTPGEYWIIGIGATHPTMARPPARENARSNLAAASGASAAIAGDLYIISRLPVLFNYVYGTASQRSTAHRAISLVFS
jgi:hypothetical protein